MNAEVSSPNTINASAWDPAEGWRVVSQQTSRFLVQMREFDLHRCYRSRTSGGRTAANTAEWVHRACGIGYDTAREMLGVAYALLNLPRIETAFENGDLSYAKVRALTPVATLQNEAELLDFARAMTDAQVEDYCGQLGSRDAGRREPNGV